MEKDLKNDVGFSEPYLSLSERLLEQEYSSKLLRWLQ